MKNTGVYLHIPFCKSKCPYCDFFSGRADEDTFEKYTGELCKRIEYFGGKLGRKADTLYFGGGTPGVLGSERLCRIYDSAKNAFCIDDDAEVTVEINPEKKDIDFDMLRKKGFNRVSLGLQSSDDRELKLLGRLHDSEQAADRIERLRSAGFDNFSLDLMIATPSQTIESLMRSIDFCAGHGAKHISAYILKIEEGTRYYSMQDKLCLADEDTQAEMYLAACEKLEEYGYKQYEISNFAVEGYESRHNLKYWHDEEYIGIGPSAHSFIDGRRFFYGRSFEDFYNNSITDDGEGGTPEEYIMLALRLTEGLTYDGYRKRFGCELPDVYIKNARRFVSAGLVCIDDTSIKLTKEGFLLSNGIISEII